MNSDVKNQLQHTFKRLLRLRVALFLLLVVIVYAFVIWRVDTLSNAQPPADVIASKLSSSKNPRIDQVTVDKITQLQDNSVNVQALFNQARQNPFHE
jgi:hypothetical protein